MPHSVECGVGCDSADILAHDEFLVLDPDDKEKQAGHAGWTKCIAIRTEKDPVQVLLRTVLDYLSLGEDTCSRSESSQP